MLAKSGGPRLPPEASQPWRWSARWLPILTAGDELGRAFATGLHKASIAAGKSMKQGATGPQLGYGHDVVGGTGQALKQRAAYQRSHQNQ